MNLIPQVKKLELQNGFLHTRAITFDEKHLDDRLVTALRKLPVCTNGAQLDVEITGSEGEAYELVICEDRIQIRADGDAGAFYAIQTLRQLFSEERVPCLHIWDRPDFPYRGFYHDVTRGKIPAVETIKRLIDQMAYFKLNSLQLYVEHVFTFEETKELWDSRGCLTGAELQEIDRYCTENFTSLPYALDTFSEKMYGCINNAKEGSTYVPYGISQRNSDGRHRLPRAGHGCSRAGRKDRPCRPCA